MGTGFDDFTPRAHALATAGIGPQAQANRARLRTAMNSGGITVYSGEWWHFDGPGAGVERPQLDAPLS
jgi:D-alanyl-D-alanine dipeptidase